MTEYQRIEERARKFNKFLRRLLLASVLLLLLECVAMVYLWR